MLPWNQAIRSTHRATPFIPPLPRPLVSGSVLGFDVLKQTGGVGILASLLEFEQEEHSIRKSRRESSRHNCTGTLNTQSQTLAFE